MNLLNQLVLYVLPLLIAFGLARYIMNARRARDQTGVNWGAFDAVSLTAALYFGSQIAVTLGVLLYAASQSVNFSDVISQSEKSTGLQFMVSCLLHGFMALGLWWLLRLRGRKFVNLGLRHPQLKDVGFVLIGIVMYVPLALAVLSIAEAVVPGLDLDQKQQIGFAGTQGWSLALVFTSLVILPPVVEELVCRGFLYLGLKRRLPKYVAVLLTSLIFAMAHLQFNSGEPLLWTAAIDTFSLSLVLIYLREATDGLWAPIGLHMAKNSLAFYLLFLR